MSGCIAIPCTDTGRFSLFGIALAQLRKPPDTEIYVSTGADREWGRNLLVRQMLDAEKDWLLFLDDDQVFAADFLERLLLHDVPIVGGLYIRRTSPFSPICYPEPGVPIDLTQYRQDALVEIAAVGTGGMLIRREVFEEMEEPWFKRELERTEDIIFCLETPFKVYCDLGARLGHLTTAAVWPATVEDQWALSFTVSGDVTFIRPLQE